MVILFIEKLKLMILKENAELIDNGSNYIKEIEIHFLLIIILFFRLKDILCNKITLV